MIPLPSIGVARRPGALLLCLALAACADVPVQAPARDTLFDDASFAPPSERMTPADVFKVSPEMRAYLDTRVAEIAASKGEARGVVEALFTDRRVQVDYDAEFTRDAQQTFHARAGNCLSLAIVTGAMAKALGLDVRYQSVQTSEHWEREGDLLELVGHVNVSVGVPGPKFGGWAIDRDRWTVDFVPSADLRHLVTEPITEARVVAMFMNNRAAEALAHRHVDDAYWWVRSGLAADPGFDTLYNTLGVTYWRKGMLARADAAFRFAIVRNPGSEESWSNYALVLRREGRPEQAALVEKAHPPTAAATLMASLDAAAKANADGRYERALELYRRALRVAADNHQLHYLMAVTYLNMGDREHAMEHLLQAEDNSTTARQRAIYSSKAEMLKTATSSFRLDPKAAQVN